MAVFTSTPPVLSPVFNPYVFTFTGVTTYRYEFEILVGVNSYTGTITPFGLTNKYIIDISDYLQNQVDVTQTEYVYEGAVGYFNGFNPEMIKHYEPAKSLTANVNFYVYVYTGSTGQFSDVFIFTGRTFYGCLTSSQFEDWCGGDYLDYTGSTSVSVINKFCGQNIKTGLIRADADYPTLFPNCRSYISAYNNINRDGLGVEVYLWDKAANYLGRALISKAQTASSNPLYPPPVNNADSPNGFTNWEWDSGQTRYECTGNTNHYAQTNTITVYASGSTTITINIKVYIGVVDVCLWNETTNTKLLDIYSYKPSPSISSVTYNIVSPITAQCAIRYTAYNDNTIAVIGKPAWTVSNVTDNVDYVSGITHSIINYRVDYDLITEILKYDDDATINAASLEIAAYATFAFSLNGQARYFPFKILKQNNFKNHLYNIIWVNRMGGIDNIVCEGKNIKSVDIERKQYQKSPLFFNSDGTIVNRRLTHQDSVYDAKRKVKYQLSSDYMSEDMYERTEDLFVSHYVWLQDLEDGKIYPVIVKSNGFIYKTYHNDGLISMQIELENAYKE